VADQQHAWRARRTVQVPDHRRREPSARIGSGLDGGAQLAKEGLDESADLRDAFRSEAPAVDVDELL